MLEIRTRLGRLQLLLLKQRCCFCSLTICFLESLRVVVRSLRHWDILKRTGDREGSYSHYVVRRSYKPVLRRCHRMRRRRMTKCWQWRGSPLSSHCLSLDILIYSAVFGHCRQDLSERSEMKERREGKQGSDEGQTFRTRNKARQTMHCLHAARSPCGGAGIKMYVSYKAGRLCCGLWCRRCYAGTFGNHMQITKLRRNLGHGIRAFYQQVKPNRDLAKHKCG